MKENMDQLEQKIREEFERFAKEEENALRESGGFIMPEGKKEELYAAIMEKAGKKSGENDEDVQSADVVEMEGEENSGILFADIPVADEKIEKRNLYAELSEEDWKALELGRKLMEQEVHEEFRAKALKKKKRKRMYIGLAAALVASFAIGVTSMGGAERVIMMVTQMVGNREVEKINSSEDNLVMAEEKEEEAYQAIEEKFGIEPVRIMYKVKNMEFKKMEFDKQDQLAELYYEYENSMLIFLINASYLDTSLGIDADDRIVDTQEEVINGHKMVIKEYKVPKLNSSKFSATFEYNGLEYYIILESKKDEFVIILENLFFPHK